MKQVLRSISLIMVLTIITSVFIPFVAYGVTTEKTAQVTTSTVLVDGISKSFEAYLIEENNYFKLRDIAMVLNGTDNQFEVSWNNDTKSIDILTNKPYTIVGNELVPPINLDDKTATIPTARIYSNGIEQNLTVYTISNNNYFKLRDLGALVGFDVTWDDVTKTIGISTTVSEVESSIDENGDTSKLISALELLKGKSVYDVEAYNLIGDLLSINKIEENSYEISYGRQTPSFGDGMWEGVIEDITGDTASFSYTHYYDGPSFKDGKIKINESGKIVVSFTERNGEKTVAIFDPQTGFMY